MYTSTPHPTPFSCQASTLLARNLRYCRGVLLERQTGNLLDEGARPAGATDIFMQMRISLFLHQQRRTMALEFVPAGIAHRIVGINAKAPLRSREYKHFLNGGDERRGVDSFSIEDFGVISSVNKIIHFAE